MAKTLLGPNTKRNRAKRARKLKKKHALNILKSIPLPPGPPPPPPPPPLPPPPPPLYCSEEEEKIDNLSKSLYLETLMKKIQESQLSYDYERRLKNLKYLWIELLKTLNKDRDTWGKPGTTDSFRQIIEKVEEIIREAGLFRSTELPARTLDERLQQEFGLKKVENVNVKPSSKKVMRSLPSSSGDSRCATSVTNNNNKMSQTRPRRDGRQESGLRRGRRENSGDRPVRRDAGDQGRRHREKYPARREGERAGRSSPSRRLKTLLFGECSDEESNRSSIKRPISLEEYRERKKNRARAEAEESWPDLVFAGPSGSASQNLLERSDDYEEQRQNYTRHHPDTIAQSGQPVQHILADVDLKTNPASQPKLIMGMNVEITAALRGDGLVVKSHNIHIETKDLNRLLGETWLNDKIIDGYLKIISDLSSTDTNRSEKLPKVYAMSSYFYENLMNRGTPAVEKWTKDVDIFEFDLILVPIHLPKHWCLAVVDFRSPGVFYYDSLGGHNMPALNLILEYLQVEHKKKRKTELDIKKFAMEIVEDCPKQDNSWDCGVFVCKVAKFLSRNVTPRFSQQDMPFFRQLMFDEITENC